MSQNQGKEGQRVAMILCALAEDYADAGCALHHDNPYQLLVATILSAQCTDARVNLVTPALFQRYPTAADLAEAQPLELQDLIRTTGFFRNKAKNLIGAARRIVADFGGRLPKTMEELLALPGVARKTANVVLGTAFGISSGVVVDTHVRRISRRLHLSQQEDPVKIEQDLMKRIPTKEWIQFSHRVIHHGRQICRARKPACQRCSLADLCPYYFRQTGGRGVGG